MKGNDKLEETDWFPSDNFFFLYFMEPHKNASIFFQFGKNCSPFFIFVCFLSDRSAHNSPLRSFLCIAIVAHLDYSRREEEKKIQFLIYHLEINQPIKNPISIKVEEGKNWRGLNHHHHQLLDGNYETIKRKCFRFPIFFLVKSAPKKKCLKHIK